MRFLKLALATALAIDRGKRYSHRPLLRAYELAALMFAIPARAGHVRISIFDTKGGVTLLTLANSQSPWRRNPLSLLNWRNTGK
jgi:hypothetical protein